MRHEPRHAAARRRVPTGYLIALVLGIMILTAVGLSVPASAGEGDPEQVAPDYAVNEACNDASITFTLPEDAPNVDVFIWENGEETLLGRTGAGGTYWLTHSNPDRVEVVHPVGSGLIPPNEEPPYDDVPGVYANGKLVTDVTVEWALKANANTNEFFLPRETLATFECEPEPIEVTPEAPTFTHPVCDTPGSVEFADTEGVKYTNAEDGQELQHGDTVTVGSQAKEGYVLNPEAETRFPFTAIRNPCDGEDGERGPQGPAGQDGEDGEDGEDAEIVTIETPTRINTGR